MAKITATSNVASGSTGAKRVVKSSESFSIDSSKITHTSPNVTAKNLNLAIEEIATQHAVATSEPSSPVEGDLWYDTDDNLFYVRVDSAWKQVYPVDLNVLATETVIADGDFIPMVDISDSNASGKITFENLEDAIFSSVSGDIAIAENGAATIQANSVALGGDTTGNYVEAVTGGTGIDSTGATSGEAISHTLSLDLNELATETTIADADFITMVDTSDSNASDKITFANVQSAIVATGALNSGSITSGFGAIDIGSSGLTAGSTSLSALSLLDGNITNVGSIQLDSIAGDGDTNTSIEFSGSDVITVSTGGETQVTFNNGSILPTTDNDVDLGSSSYEFKDGYFDGTVYADAINFNGTAIGSTAAELNLLDGSAKSTSSITIADADAFIVIDGTTTKQIPASDLETYMESSLDTLSNVTTVGTLNSGSISSGFGAIDIGTSGLTAGSTSLTGLSLLDGNITNAGDINCDSISIDDAAVGLNIDFGGNTTLNKITLTDNLADALNITESSNSYLKFVTSNSGEKITLGKKLEAGSVEIEGSAFDIDGGTIDGTDVTVGSGKTLDVSGGTLTLANDQISGDKVSGGTIGTTTITALAGALSLGDNNITNVSDIALDSISADGTDINVAVSDDSATAFTIKQGVNAYLVIDTANSSESVAIGTGISGTGITIGHSTSETTVADNLTVTGNLKVNGDTVTQNVSTMTVNDPIISLQTADDGANLGSDSNKDVGLAMFYHTGSAAKTAFLGWDDSAGKLTFVPDASISSEVVSGSVGTIVANLEGDVTGDVAGNVSGTAATVTGAAQTNITSLGTLTALTVDNLGVNGNTITANSGALNLTPASGSAIVLDGTINVDAGVVTGATSITSTAFVGNITGNVTGNTSGTAATVTAGAQSSITSLGTLTTLTVDNVIINGTTIGHTGDTDLMTVASGVLTVAGEVSMTTLDIGGTNVTSDANELNILDGATVVVGEINALDLGSTAVGTAIASKAVILDSNKDYTGIRNLTVTGELDGASLDIEGDADINGTLEADAITVNGSTLASVIAGTTVANATLAATTTVTDSTANTNFPVIFHDESNALLDDTGALRYNPSTGTLLVPNLSVAGTTTTVDTVTMEASNAIIFEGATADAHETTFSIVDPTADRTINLPNQSGTLPVLNAVSATAITSTPEELNILDGATVVVGEINALDLGSTAVGTAIASKAVILDSNKDYTGIRNLTITGELDSATLDVSGDADIDGTTNLDAVDIDGNVQLDGTLTVGVDGTGKDVKLFGDTSGAYILWDESADKLLTAGGALVDIVKDKLMIGSTAVTTTAAELNLLDGVTATTTEINLLDGDTSPASVTIADSDQIILNDAGTMKQVAVTALNTYTSSSVAADNLSAASANVTIDAAGNNTDIIFKGTDDTSDITMLTLDGSEAGAATFNNKVVATELDISGNADIDGTLEADAYTVDGTALNEYIADTVGAMVGSNTESGITVAYQDADNTLDFTVGTLNQDTTGTAATVTGAAQSNITSLGTLTTLTVDNVIVNGTTIGHTSDTDLMTVADGLLTVAGEVSMTTLDIGGTNVTSTAAELNILDGVTSTAAELNILDGVTSTAAELNALDGITAVVGELNALDIGSTAVGTAVASKAVILDSNKDYTGLRNLTITGELDAATLDISGDIDVDGTANLDAVDIDGAVDMAGNLTVATGSVLSGVGRIVQVVSATKADMQSSTSTNFTISNLTATITPTNSANKILILAHVSFNHAASQYCYFTLRKDGGAISIGDASNGGSGARGRATTGAKGINELETRNVAFNYLDSPNTTSSTAYTIQVNGDSINSSYLFYINSFYGDTDAVYAHRSTCSITAMEIQSVS